MEVKLSDRLSALPREIVVGEIIPWIGSLSMIIVRGTLLGVAYSTPIEDHDAYKYGLEFLLWCILHLRLFVNSRLVGLHGDPDMIKWACKNGHNSHLYIGAANSGSLSRMKLLHEIGYMPDREVHREAANSGSLECLVWLTKVNCKWNYTLSINAAIRSGSLECVRYLFRPQRGRDAEYCNNAAGHGKLNILKWLREQGCSFNKFTCNMAILGGHLEVLKWLHENGSPWDSRVACEAAVQRKSLACLKYLHDNGVVLEDQLCLHTAINGWLEGLAWLHQVGIRHKDALNAATRNARLNCCRWLRSVGYEWDSESYKCVWISFSDSVLEYAHETGCVFGEDAKSSASIKIIRWMKNKGLW